MLQRIRNVLQVTWRRCYDVAGTSCLCVHRNMNVITPPHSTPPVTDHERAVQCLCLQDSKKDDEVAVPDSMSQPRVPKCYPKGMILWCSKWSTFQCSKWSPNPMVWYGLVCVYVCARVFLQVSAYTMCNHMYTHTDTLYFICAYIIYMYIIYIYILYYII